MISQYANSPRFVKLVEGMRSQFNNAQTIEDWFNVVYNLKTAEGYGLDIWGIILNRSRYITYNDNGTEKTVYLKGAKTVDGIDYTEEQIENLYRSVLFLTLMSYITNATMNSLSLLLRDFFKERGICYIVEYNPMEIRIVFDFYLNGLESVIFPVVMPKPTGVGISFQQLPLSSFFGFFVEGLNPDEQPYAPFDNKPFYW